MTRRRLLEPQVVGERVRLLRTARGISVRALATRGGFSPSFISQVELGQASPSIDSLQRIGQILGVTMGEFFVDSGDGHPGAVTRRLERRILRSGWSKAAVEALSTAPAPIEALLVVLTPGGRSGTRPRRHVTAQFALMVKGRAVLTLDSRDHLLGPGDSALIEAGEPALWRNDSDRSAQILIVSVRPPRRGSRKPD